MTKFGFYLLGEKGYRCLIRFVENYGTKPIAFVVSDSDKGLKKDFFEEISRFCADNHIILCDRRKKKGLPKSNFDFAVGWRWLIPEYQNLIVFHDSILPKYRGFSPLVNMLINGEKRIGVTALKASEEYDAGDIAAQATADIFYPIKIAEAIGTVTKLYEKVLIEITNKLMVDGSLATYSQDSSMVTYSLWRDEHDYCIDWQNSSDYILRFINALGYPYLGAISNLNGRVVRVLDAELVDDVAVEDRISHVGKTIFIDSGIPTVVCRNGLIKLTNIVDEEGTSLIGKIPFRSRFGV